MCMWLYMYVVCFIVCVCVCVYWKLLWDCDQRYRKIKDKEISEM